MESAMDNTGVNLESPSNDVAAPRAYVDDTPMMSSQALEALKEFLSEQNREIKSGDDAAKEVALWRRTGGSASSDMISLPLKPLLPKSLSSAGASVPLPLLALLAPPCTHTSRKLILECLPSFLSSTRGLSNTGLSSRFIITTSLRIFYCL